MQSNAVLAAPGKRRPHADPVETVPLVALLVTWIGGFVLDLLRAIYGLGDAWWRRKRDTRLARIPWLMFFLDYLLVVVVGFSTLDELIGLGGTRVLLPSWTAVMIGLLGTGWAFFTRPLRRGVAQGAAIAIR